MAETEYVSTSMNLAEAAFDGCPAFEEFGDMSGTDASIVQDATDGATAGEDADGSMGDHVVYGEDYDEPGSFGNEDLQSVGPVPRLASGVVANDFEGQPPLKDVKRACRDGRRFGMFGKEGGLSDMGRITSTTQPVRRLTEEEQAAARAAPEKTLFFSSGGKNMTREAFDERARQDAREDARLRAEREERDSARKMQLFTDIFGGVAQAGAQIGGGILQQKADARAARRDRRLASQSGPVSYGGGGGGGGSNMPWIVGGVAVLGLGAWLVLGGKKK